MFELMENMEKNVPFLIGQTENLSLRRSGAWGPKLLSGSKARAEVFWPPTQIFPSVTFLHFNTQGNKLEKWHLGPHLRKTGLWVNLLCIHIYMNICVYSPSLKKRLGRILIHIPVSKFEWHWKKVKDYLFILKFKK